MTNTTQHGGVSDSLARLFRLLSSRRYRFANELQLQDGIESVLKEAAVNCDRERILGGAAGRIDFFLPDNGLGIEVKTGSGGGPTAVLQQLLRYADDSAINGLLLVSTRASGCQLPALLRGKPFLALVLWANGI